MLGLRTANVLRRQEKEENVIGKIKDRKGEKEDCEEKREEMTDSERGRNVNTQQ